MIEILHYLNSKEKDYNEGVIILKKYAPNHPLLKSIQRGDTFINRHYLTTALKTTAKNPPKAAKKEKTNPNDPILTKLLKEQKTLIIERVKRSNSFHVNLQNPINCAKISDQLRVLHTKIRTVTNKIECYRKYNRLPTEKTNNKKFTIPGDSGERIKKLASLKSSRSTYRKKATTETDPNKKIKISNKLTDLETKINQLETAINTQKNEK